MRLKCLKTYYIVIFTMFALSSLPGCENHMALNTATKFGIDVSQQMDQPPKVDLGYKREETVIIPAIYGQANEKQDTYSAISDVCVYANPSLWDFIRAVLPTTEDVPDALQVQSLFVTGKAAQTASKNKQLRKHFRDQIAGDDHKGNGSTPCF